MGIFDLIVSKGRVRNFFIFILLAFSFVGQSANAGRLRNWTIGGVVLVTGVLGCAAYLTHYNSPQPVSLSTSSKLPDKPVVAEPRPAIEDAERSVRYTLLTQQGNRPVVKLFADNPGAAQAMNAHFFAEEKIKERRDRIDPKGKVVLLEVNEVGLTRIPDDSGSLILNVFIGPTEVPMEAKIDVRDALPGMAQRITFKSLTNSPDRFTKVQCDFEADISYDGFEYRLDDFTVKISVTKFGVNVNSEAKLSDAKVAVRDRDGREQWVPIGPLVGKRPMIKVSNHQASKN